MKLSLLLCQLQEVLTLRNLWALGCSVIVSYEHSISSCHSDLWPHIPYWWANKCKAEALIEAFEHRKKQGRPGIPSIYPSPNSLWIKLCSCVPFHVCFVFQVVSSWRELISQRTWNTSALTRQSPWGTWWRPRIPRCWAGLRSRPPAPKSAPSISSLETLSQRAALYRLLLHWMRNYWNGPRDFSIINYFMEKNVTRTMKSLGFFFVTLKYLNYSSAYNCTYYISVSKYLFWYFDLHWFYYLSIPILLSIIGLLLLFAIYSVYIIRFHELTSFNLQWLKQ